MSHVYRQAVNIWQFTVPRQYLSTATTTELMVIYTLFYGNASYAALYSRSSQGVSLIAEIVKMGSLAR